MTNVRRSPIKLFVTISLLCLAMFLSLVFLVSYKTKKLADDVWKQLGIPETTAKQKLVNSFLDGHLYASGLKNAKNIISNNRVVIVKEVAAYAKQYVNSVEFRQKYEAFRLKKKPIPPVVPQLTPEIIRKQERARLEDQLKTLEANINSPNLKLKNSIPARMEAVKKDLSELDNPDNKTVKTKMDYEAKTYEYSIKRYSDAVIKFEKDFPENHLLMVKKRLEELLLITNDIDFNAALKEAYEKQVFVNPVYQSKPAEWKLAFRAGKETTEAVRTLAQQWMQEIK